MSVSTHVGEYMCQWAHMALIIFGIGPFSNLFWKTISTKRDSHLQKIGPLLLLRHALVPSFVFSQVQLARRAPLRGLSWQPIPLASLCLPVVLFLAPSTNAKFGFLVFLVAFLFNRATWLGEMITLTAATYILRRNRCLSRLYTVFTWLLQIDFAVIIISESGSYSQYMSQISTVRASKSLAV